jgi:predicted regulator of Ras-like GTPase activity (Roadblock/LC7/MglB family)
MGDQTLEERISALLSATNDAGGYTGSCVCTADGLVVASAGGDAEDTAAVVSLFDDVMIRARRDLGFSGVDEVALLEPGAGRLVIRPLDMGAEVLFLVVSVPARRTWRRHTNTLRRQLQPLLEPLVARAS